MTRRADQRGFTLVELLVSMMLALVVVGGAFGLVSATERSSKNVRDRVDVSQRGRVAMEQITQELRAMACPEPAPGAPAAIPSPIISGTRDEIQFYTNIVDRTRLGSTVLATQNSAFVPQKRALVVERDAGGQPTAIREDRWVDGEALPPVSRYIIDDIRAATTGEAPAPVVTKDPFTYYPHSADPAVEPIAFGADAGLSDADRALVSQVRIAFRVLPSEGARDDLVTADMESSVYSRTFTNVRDNDLNVESRFFQCQ